MRRIVLRTAGICLAATLVTLPALAQVKEIGKGEGFVDIIAWPGYIERGETDKGYDWVTGFEQKSGCKVRVKTAGTTSSPPRATRASGSSPASACSRSTPA
jgi:putative spermidine/putrescine transport system substrate-binding protein